MKMKANENFHAAVVAVLNELKTKQIKSKTGVITYLLTEDIVQRNSRFNGFEREAVEFLKSEEVIEVLERDELVIGEPGQKNHTAYQSLKLKILKSLDIFLEKYALQENAFSSGKLLFRVTTGETTYFDSLGKSYTIICKPRTIPYQMLANILSALGKNIPYEECVIGVEDKRSHGDTDDEEKVRNALKSIRKQFRNKGVADEEVDSLFLTSYGVSVGIPYTIIP